MAGQLTIFGKEAEEKVEEKPKTKFRDDTPITYETDKATKEHCNFVEDCKKKKIKFKAVLISTISRSTLEGIDCYLNVTSQTDNCWGTGGNYENEEELLNEKLSLCENYFSENEDYWWCNNIEAKNMKLFITKKAKELLEKRGINIRIVMKKWGDFKNKKPTKENLKEFERIVEIEKRFVEIGIHHKTDCYKDELKEIKQAIKGKMGMRESSYSRNKAVCPMKYANMKVEELIELRKKLIEGAKELGKEGDFLLQKYWNNRSDYFSYYIKFVSEW